MFRSVTIPKARRPRARVLAATATVAGLAALGGSALAGGGGAYFGGGPQSAASAAPQRAVALGLADGRAAGIWVAPTAEGGRCVILSMGTAAPTPSSNRGGWCERPPLRPAAAPMTTTVNWLMRSTGDYDVLVAGEVSKASRIARVELQSADGATRVPLAAGYFLAQLPTVAAAGDLPTAAAPYTLVGFDRAGARVATVDLARLVAASSPPAS